ncbi:unnamed protein product [Ranitomeya imitator]|uniref:Uncharacterized protein n=1 Tax=Ranitomeya imitator TaxID=111125 RepID=A0ABN9MBQ4_9NEOB|nr:unnamed protein product [Ranitomeya imitator]
MRFFAAKKRIDVYGYDAHIAIYYVGCAIYYVGCAIYYVGCAIYYVGCYTLRGLLYTTWAVIHYVGCYTLRGLLYTTWAVIYDVSCAIHYVGCVIYYAGCVIYYVGCVMHYVGCVIYCVRGLLYTMWLCYTLHGLLYTTWPVLYTTWAVIYYVGCYILRGLLYTTFQSNHQRIHLNHPKSRKASSFHEFARSTSDAWDIDDDESEEILHSVSYQTLGSKISDTEVELTSNFKRPEDNSSQTIVTSISEDQLHRVTAVTTNASLLLPIIALEIRTVRLVQQQVHCLLAGHPIRIPLDNATAVPYVNHLAEAPVVRKPLQKLQSHTFRPIIPLVARISDQNASGAPSMTLREKNAP